jgi:hypothetical protein
MKKSLESSQKSSLRELLADPNSKEAKAVRFCSATRGSTRCEAATARMPRRCVRAARVGSVRRSLPPAAVSGAC